MNIVRKTSITSNLPVMTKNVSNPQLKPGHYRCSEYSQYTLKRLQKLYESKDLCNITLIAGIDSKKIRAIDFVLAETSPFFNNKIQKPNESNEILLDNISGEILEMIVQFCYTGVMQINEITLKHILEAAKMLCIQSIIDICTAFIKKELKNMNCLQYRILADTYKLPELSEVCSKYIQDNFLRISNEEDFLKLDYQDVGLLLDSNNLKVKSENQVCNAVLNWISYDPANRTDFISYFFSKLRLPFMDLDYFRQKIVPLNLSANDMKLINEAIIWKMKPRDDLRYLTHIQTVPRKETDVAQLPAAYVLGYSKQYKKFIMYNLETREWTILNDFPEFDYDIKSFSYYKNNLVIVGRRKRTRVIVESVNLKTLERFAITQYSVSSECKTIAIEQDFIYFATQQEIICFSLKTKLWTSLVGFPNGLALHEWSAALMNNKIYIFGENDACKKMEVLTFNMHELSITTATSSFASLKIHTFLQLAFPFVFNNSICFICVHKAQNTSIASYKPSINKWYRLVSTNTPTGHAIIRNSSLMLFNFESYSCSEFTKATRKWHTETVAVNRVRLVKGFPKFSAIFTTKMMEPY